MVKPKKYDKMKIISLDGSTICKRIRPTNGLTKLTALKNGKLDIAKFNGILDESLDTDQLKAVYALHKGEMGVPYVEQGQYTRALVNVRFDYAVKEFEQYGRRYVRYGYDVSDADMTDHLCVWKVDGEPMLIAVEVPYEKDKDYAPVENPVDAELLGKYFEYDKEARAYKRSEKAIPSAVKVDAIREELYRDGFDIDSTHYVRYKRSAGSSREGNCLFIAEPLYKDMMEWSACGLSAEEAEDQASWQAYIALTLSSIEKTIKLPKKAILIMQDKVSTFTDTAVCVKEDPEEGLIANEEETVIENVIWDGEALLDVSIFEENGYADKGMMLLRNRFFKTCAFNTNLQKWFADRGVTSVKSLNGFTLARKIEDVKLVITESSLKYLKFMPKGATYAEGFKRWLDAVYEGTNTSEFGVVKTDKPSPLMGGYMAYTNYQLLNTLGITYEGVEMLLEQSLSYLDRIRNDPVYLRHYLNKMSSAAEIDEEDELSLDTYRQDTVLDMICRTPDFEHTDFYKCFRSDLVKRFKNKLRRGRIAVIGNYQTLFGNPYEFLLALVDKSYEPTESKLLGNEEIYNTMYMPNQIVLCARSPHITMGNLYVAQNIPHREIDDYFNLTPNIVCVNAIRNNLQQRLNGCDYDSDSMLVTGDKWLAHALAAGYKHMKVPVCKVNPCGKTEYTNTPESLAKLDIAIAENKIGEIVNLSQFLNCLLWDRLHHPNTTENQLALYYDICKLAVLSGMEIDKAKRLYPVDTNKVLRLIGKRKNEYKKANGGQLPSFFSYMTGDETASRDRSEAHLNTPMSFIYDQVNRCSGRAKQTKTIPISELFALDPDDAGANDTHKKQNIIEAVKKANDEIVSIKAKAKRCKSDERIILREKADRIFADCLSVVSKNIVNDHVLSMLLYEIDHASESKYDIKRCRHFLFSCMLYEKNRRLISKVKVDEKYKPTDLITLDDLNADPFEGSVADDAKIEFVYSFPHVRAYIPKKKK